MSYHAQIALMGLCLAAGCTDLSPTPSTVTQPGSALSGLSSSTGQRSAADILTGTEPRGIESDILKVEVAASGFGGFFIDANGEIGAWVTPNADTLGVKGALAQLGAKRPDVFLARNGRPRAVRLLRGVYAFSQLVNFKEVLRTNWTLSDGIRLLDADESKNQVRVGISSASLAASLLAKVQRLGIPASAITFEDYSGNFASTSTVQDYARPIHAGIKISRPVSGDTLGCTMGFNVETPAGSSYFLTASHCSQSFTGNVGKLWYQAAYGDLAGQEAVNPAWATSGCAPGALYCTTADAELIARDPSVPFEYTVVQTSIVGSGNNAGNLDIGSNLSVASSRDAASGEQVYHTGQGSGTKQGPVIGTCVDLPAYGNPAISLSCQYEVRSLLTGGDSGSPVYYWNFPLVLTVRYALGIAHSSYTSPNGGHLMYYSTWQAIQNKFGTLYPF